MKHIRNFETHERAKLVQEKFNKKSEFLSDNNLESLEEDLFINVFIDLFNNLKIDESVELDKMFSIRIPKKLLSEYRNYCEENSINMSKRLRKFIEKDLESWKKRRTKI